MKVKILFFCLLLFLVLKNSVWYIVRYLVNIYWVNGEWKGELIVDI